MQDTCTSTKDTTSMPRKMRRMLQRMCISTMEIKVTWKSVIISTISAVVSRARM